MLSLPTRERGLKFLTRRQTDCTIPVAPYAGAWIEIHKTDFNVLVTWVAPYAGAWIEIQ